MAYEITYFYHEKKAEGGYNTEEKKELKKKVGSGFDDVPLEQVAMAIIKQLARRDIWVVDVEVSEYLKKKISFKESTDGSGIVLKNKKFSFDHSASLVIQDISTDVISEEVSVHPVLQRKSDIVKKPGGVNLVETPVDPARILYWVIFEPHPFTHEARAKGLKFTVGKKYPVHRTKTVGEGTQVIPKLILTDDSKRIVEVDDKYFTAAGAGLVGDNEVEGGFNHNVERDDATRLSYWSHMQGGNDVPQLRSKNLKNIPDQYKGIPLDDGSIPDTYFDVPDIRKKK